MATIILRRRKDIYSPISEEKINFDGKSVIPFCLNVHSIYWSSEGIVFNIFGECQIRRSFRGSHDVVLWLMGEKDAAGNTINPDMWSERQMGRSFDEVEEG